MKSMILVMLLLLLGTIFLWGSVMGGICLLCLVIGVLRLGFYWFQNNDDFDIYDKD
jgi:hypothetical protein